MANWNIKMEYELAALSTGLIACRLAAEAHVRGLADEIGQREFRWGSLGDDGVARRRLREESAGYQGSAQAKEKQEGSRGITWSNARTDPHHGEHAYSRREIPQRQEEPNQTIR